ncbi:MAG TPA: OmpA family protein [Hyphomicrobiaceae bacterium]|nr:OmpA family protein [Hyphomicrobiaceae bacterium]
MFSGDRRPPPIGVAPTGQVVRPGTPIVGRTVTNPVGPRNISDFRNERVRTTDRSGRQLIQEPGNRTIIVQGNRRIIHRNEFNTIRNYYPGARTIPLPNGITQTSYVRADGMRVFTETDRTGRIVRRFGRGSGGRTVVFVDNRRFYRNVAIGAGIAAIGVGVALALAPPAIAIPRERYIVDYDRASEEDIYEALSAPPVERLERRYSLDEIRYSDSLRSRMRRVDLDTITFDTGSVEVTEDQYPKLERIARAIARVIERDPAETFLVEGHTDAVGDNEDNLSLSDRRAEAVARVLTEYYAIPLENIVTQGYGEQHLKIETQGPERANRRVAIRRITPLLAQE